MVRPVQASMRLLDSLLYINACECYLQVKKRRNLGTCYSSTIILDTSCMHVGPKNYHTLVGSNEALKQKTKEWVQRGLELNLQCKFTRGRCRLVPFLLWRASAA
ncbi:hypothetical protein M408DRAFT_86444 [Serendipita vermifera MAFF 305830]|uniref:Uncharacterized protein n=1 Tax=Serendipita vermifera MAFF 305830 TaxID=933852 RepID=A0A0C2X6Y3_SERVB|nr:hypothetical protein M408DRAFT_86444 [Serendipita vermifera MAFF 305830]